MARLRLHEKKSHTPAKREVLVITLDGIISTPTIQSFRAALTGLLARDRDIILDLGDVSYMNSSGLGELLKTHDALQQRDLSLILTNLRPDILRLIQMLGLAQVLSILPDNKTALAGIDTGLSAAVAEAHLTAEAKPYHARGEGFVPTVAAPAPRLPDANILLGAAKDSYFTRFLARCLIGNGGQAQIVSDVADVRTALAQGRVDLVIMDRNLPAVDEMCAVLKCAPDNGILSVIYICVPGETQVVHAPCRVCEDEAVIEPFEVRELIVLAESEHGRCQAESILFTQEARLVIESGEAAQQRGHALVERLILSSGLDEEPAHGFIHAVREALDNARRHGHADANGTQVDLHYIRDREKLTVAVSDQGEGFDYALEIKRGQDVSPLERARERHDNGAYGGLGISMMLRCCDKVEYAAPGNIVTLTKYI